MTSSRGIMNEPTNSQLLIYQTEDGRIKLDVRYQHRLPTHDARITFFEMVLCD